MCEKYCRSLTSRSKEQQSSSRQLQQMTEEAEDEEMGDYTPTAVGAGGVLRKIKSGAALPDILKDSGTPLFLRRNSDNDIGRFQVLKYRSQSSSKIIESSFVSTQLKYDRRLSSARRKTNAPQIDHSLERIHTFHLKKRPVMRNHQDDVMTIVTLDPSDLSKGKKPVSIKRNSTNTQFLKHVKGSFIKGDKAFYFQEKALVQQDAFLRSTLPVIFELERLLTKGEDGNLTHLRHAFRDDKEIDSLRVLHKFKLSIRSILGLAKASLSQMTSKISQQSGVFCSTQRDDQWIYHLNIGNVMHLQPLSLNEMQAFISNGQMNSEEDTNPHLGSADTMISPIRDTESVQIAGAAILSNPSSTSRQFNAIVNQKNGYKGQMEKIKQELSKNELLDKIVLVVVSLFCMGTELRFKSQHFLQNTTGGLNQSSPSQNGTAGDDQKRDKLYKEIRASSERYHGNAIHLATIFLPDECPLVGHMINSYKKHHMARGGAQRQSGQRIRQLTQGGKEESSEGGVAITPSKADKNSSGLFDEAKKVLVQEASFFRITTQNGVSTAAIKPQATANCILGKPLNKLQMFQDHRQSCGGMSDCENNNPSDCDSTSERFFSKGVDERKDDINLKANMLEQSIKITQITRNVVNRGGVNAHTYNCSMKSNNFTTLTKEGTKKKSPRELGTTQIIKAIISPSRQYKKPAQPNVRLLASQQRSPRELIKPTALQNPQTNKKYYQFSRELLAKGGNEKKKLMEKGDRSSMSDLGGDVKEAELSNGVQAVNREFGSIKRPLDTMKDSGGYAQRKLSPKDIRMKGEVEGESKKQNLTKYRSQQNLLMSPSSAIKTAPLMISVDLQQIVMKGKIVPK